MVAGISLYGDIQACIDSLNFSPNVFVYSARVTNAENRFDDESQSSHKFNQQLPISSPITIVEYLISL